MIVLRNKSFTIWDETDNLKRMKDSDILAEKKKPTGTTFNQMSNHVVKTSVGTLAGAGIGAGIGATAGLIKPNPAGRWASMGKYGKTLGLVGAGVGAMATGIPSLMKIQKQKNENKAYNERLEFAQRQAKRRERKDWKQNMTQRDGYSY